MERNYKAFISYRHLPLDLEYAKKLHSTIEHYIIPGEYRRDGQKKLGLVFRDKDELPITNNLTNNLRMALDHSEYLILICSPKTKESVWVLEEIEYFIRTHDRDHVLVLIVEGDPGSVFPAELTEVYDENGCFVQHIEPLAANIASDSAGKRSRLFQVEVLRILATLIGCPFDALYRREQRRKLRRLAVSAAATLAVSGAFIGMLLNRNAQIQRQLQETLRKEAEMGATLSEVALQEAHISEAIRLAYDALPKDGEKPYVAEAEVALSHVLMPYRTDEFQGLASIEQESTINSIRVSPDGSTAVTLDKYGILRSYETATGRLLWSRNGVAAGADYSEEGYLIVRPSVSFDSIAALDPMTQEIIWENACENPVKLLGYGAMFANGDDGRLQIYRTGDGSLLAEIKLPEEYGFSSVSAPAVSQDLHYVVFEVKNDMVHSIHVWDLKEGTLTRLDDVDSNMYGMISFLFTSENTFMTALEPYENNVPICLYEHGEKGWECVLRDKIEKNYDPMKNGDAVLLGGAPDLFLVDEDLVGLVSRRYIMLFNREDLSLVIKQMQEDLILGHCVIDDGRVAVVMQNNTLAFFDENGMSSQKKVDYMTWDADISGGAIGGRSRESIVAAVRMKKHPDRMTFIGYVQEESADYIGSSYGQEAMRYYAAEDGSGEAWFGYLQDTKEVFAVLRAADGSLRESSMVVDEYGVDRYLTDFCYLGEGLLKGPTLTLDLGQRIYYENQDHLLPDHTILQGGNGYALVGDYEYAEDSWDKIYTYYAFRKEDRAKFPISDISYAIIRDSFLPLASQLAMGEKEAYMAFVTEDMSLQIRDLEKDEILCDITEDVYTPEISWMKFVQEDEILITLGESGRIRFYDVKTGKQLSSVSFESRNVAFHKRAYYHLETDPARNLLFLFMDDSSYTETGAFVFTLDTLQSMGMITGAQGYRSSSGELVMKAYKGDPYFIPYLTTEQLLEKAGERIAAQAADCP